MSNFKLSNRLLKIASKVDYNISNFLDIGSDHGYLVVYLAKNNYPGRLYASENKLGPFNNLKNNIVNFGFQNKIFPLLGNGLDVYLEDIKQVCISGMGGNSIIEILSNGLKKGIKLDCLILEPQNEYYKLRKFLNYNFYSCIDEEYILEEKKYYPIMVYKLDKKINLTEIELHYGKLALKNKDPILFEYLKNRKFDIEQIIGRLSENNMNYTNLCDELERVKKAIDYEKFN